MKKPLHIGIDFDNTIVCYDDVFYAVALEQNRIPPHLSSSKTVIRDYFRTQNKEHEWTHLQGYVYGARMDLAKPFQGIDAFFSFCHARGIQLSIISHKTKHPYLGPQYDLHKAAKEWLLNQSFFDPRIATYFELTLPEKLQRIKTAACDYFIDDLPELLREPAFPSTTQKILFDPSNHYPKTTEWTTFSSWDKMPSILNSYSHS